MRKQFDANKKPIYSNCRMLSPTNVLIAMCGKEKMDWYLERDLAEKMDEKIFRLKFIPKGNGHDGDLFYLSEKENKCVVCGSTGNLTKHHVVPYCVRRHLDAIKHHNNHDIIPLCDKCHQKYETLYAKFLKEKIVKEIIDRLFSPEMVEGLPDKIHKKNKKEYIQVLKDASALMTYTDVMSLKRIRLLRKRIADYLGKTDEELSPDDIVMLGDMFAGVYDRGRFIAENSSDLKHLVLRWRENFIKSMCPKFMPQYWDVNKSITLD